MPPPLAARSQAGDRGCRCASPAHCACLGRMAKLFRGPGQCSAGPLLTPPGRAAAAGSRSGGERRRRQWFHSPPAPPPRPRRMPAVHPTHRPCLGRTSPPACTTFQGLRLPGRPARCLPAGRGALAARQGLSPCRLARLSCMVRALGLCRVCSVGLARHRHRLSSHRLARTPLAAGSSLPHTTYTHSSPHNGTVSTNTAALQMCMAAPLGFSPAGALAWLPRSRSAAAQCSTATGRLQCCDT